MSDMVDKWPALTFRGYEDAGVSQLLQEYNRNYRRWYPMVWLPYSTAHIAYTDAMLTPTLGPVTVLEAALGMGGSWGDVVYDNPGQLPMPSDWPLIQLCYDFLSRLDAEPVDNPARDGWIRGMVLDIGASTGSFALLPKFLPKRRLAAFEPHPMARSILRYDLRANGIDDRVYVYGVALASQEVRTTCGRFTNLYIPLEAAHAGLSTIGSRDRLTFVSGNSESVYAADVMVETLDHVLTEDVFEGERIALIKLDVEGAEYDVLMGGLKTIQRDRPDMLIEVAQERLSQFEDRCVDSVLNALRELGYVWKMVSAHDIWASHVDHRRTSPLSDDAFDNPRSR